MIPAPDGYQYGVRFDHPSSGGRAVLAPWNGDTQRDRAEEELARLRETYAPDPFSLVRRRPGGPWEDVPEVAPRPPLHEVVARKWSGGGVWVGRRTAAALLRSARADPGSLVIAAVTASTLLVRVVTPGNPWEAPWRSPGACLGYCGPRTRGG